MLLSTTIPIATIEQKIDYSSEIISVGSCFAVNMADKFKQFQFRNMVNPFGILFHPVAIEKMIRNAQDGRVYTEKDVFYHNEVWSCFDAHSDVNKLKQNDIVDKLNDQLQTFKQGIVSATHFILTLGTAWVYRHIESDHMVANCHKVPQNQFTKELLSVADCERAIEKTEKGIRELNPKIQIIYTISPVRHIKDGFVENQRSKAHLIAALQSHLEKNTKNNYYFPSYEIVMDELRDYRFYEKDLIHPNALAIDYIWEKFSKHIIHPQCYPIMKKVDEVQKGLAHRPFHPYSKAHLQFQESLARKLDDLLRQYPHMNFR